jgi:hypothetical protein
MIILDVRETLKELLKEDFVEYNSMSSSDYIEDYLTVPIVELSNGTNSTETSTGL